MGDILRQREKSFSEPVYENGSPDSNMPRLYPSAFFDTRVYFTAFTEPVILGLGTRWQGRSQCLLAAMLRSTLECSRVGI